MVTGNLFHDDYDRFVEFDGSSNNVVTDNACYNIDRSACVTLYSDRNSVVNHHTAATGLV